MAREMKNNRPGVMFYFDIRPSLKRLSLAEKGKLFEAILDFAEYGQEPDVKGAAAIAWDFIKPGIERDAERYECVVEQRRYATYAREAKKRGETVLPFDEWKKLYGNEKHHPISDDTERYPTNNLQLSTTTPTTTPTESIGAEPISAKVAEGKAVRQAFGRYGWVKLSAEEYNRLSNDLGKAELERCIAYVDESAQSTGNKNRWRDWNLVLRRCHRDGWGVGGGAKAEKQPYVYNPGDTTGSL